MSTIAEARELSLPLELPPETAELQERARRFVDEVVIPLEQEAERLYGRLPAETMAEVRQAGIDAGLNGGQHSTEYGGQGWSLLDWVVVEEQYGRSTNGIYWHVPNAYNVFHNASAEQAEKYLRPLIAGKMKDAYAVTEAEAGSDPSGSRPRRAHRRRLPDQRREVVCHLRRHRRRADRDGERHRRGGEAADAVPGRRRRAGRRDRR